MSEENYPSITTKSGDTGYGYPRSGYKVRKDDIIFELIGTLDEVNSMLGFSVCEGSPEIKRQFEKVQIMIFEISGFLAMNKPFDEKSKSYTETLEQWAVELEKSLTPMDSFILPGGHVSGARIHVTRTVARRCERIAVQYVNETSTLSKEDASVLIKFLNRLSDYLFIAARYQNYLNGVPETKWLP